MTRILPDRVPQPSADPRCVSLDPVTDPRWGRIVQSHPKASVFHTVPWLRALQSTYGYAPVAFTTSSSDSDLKNGLVGCEIDSWLTGRRFVALPFSDHCDPLCDSAEELAFFIRHLQLFSKQEKLKYFQLRPVHENSALTDGGTGCFPSDRYFLHAIDLRPQLDDIFLKFDKDSVQRRIQRADRAGLVERCGRSEELLNEFYRLFLLTRRRHRVPPTPYLWFQNLIRELGESLEIRVAYQEKTPIASIITLQFRDISYYKYGCSDERFNRFGATPWLFWNAIRSAKGNGAREFDMGRTEPDHLGLLAFKNLWVQHPKQLVYWQFPSTPRHLPGGQQGKKVAAFCLSLLPETIQKSIGNFIYRHIG